MPRRNIWEHIARELDLHEPSSHLAPLIELIDNRSVLIENHCGVTQYSEQKVCVKTVRGCVEIIGSGLHLIQMSKEQLCIQGCIHTLHLLGGGNHGKV